MNITLADLPLGKWRYFTPAEMSTMEELVAHSSKTAEGSSNNNYDTQE